MFNFNCLLMYWMIAGLFIACLGLYCLRSEIDGGRDFQLFVCFIILYLTGFVVLPVMILDSIYHCILDIKE